MKILKALLIAVVVFALVGMPHPAAAQIYTYTSGIQVQNLSDQDAVVTLTYYSQQTSATAGGTQVTVFDDTILGSKSKTYYPVHAPAGFKGSVVISSSTPLASIVNLTAPGVGNAAYVGMGGGATSISLPLLMKGNSGYTTWFSVQNTDSTNASVSVSYTDGTSTTPVSIKPNASYIFNQSTETHSAKVFGATLTSDRPIVVVVVQEGATLKNIGVTTGFDISKADTTAYMPLVNENNAGYQTGIQVANLGTQDTDITITYNPSTFGGRTFGTKCTETRTVAHGGTTIFSLFAFAQTAPTSASDCTKVQFVGAAQITGNTNGQKVVAVVNQFTSVLSGSYGSFTPGQASAKLVMPLIHDRNSGWWTGFTLQNVGLLPVHVNCTFTNSAHVVQADLDAGQVMLDLQNGVIADHYVGSATCTATGSGTPKIVAVVNETAPGSGDALATYEAVNIP